MTERTPQRVYLDLQKLARDQGRNTQQLFELYIHERFLARVAESQYADRLVLKGGMLLAVLELRRGTRDADMLARGLVGDESRLKAVVGEIASIPMADGVDFDTEAISTATIREGAEYEGIRLAPQASGAPNSSSGSICPLAIRSSRSRSITRRCSATKAFRFWAIRWRA